MSITEARKRIFELTENVQRPGTVYTFTQKGRPKAVMISAEEFEALVETIEAYRQFPDLDQDSKEAWEQFKRGQTVSLEEIAKRIKKQPNHVARRRAKKGTKRPRTRR